MSIRHLTFLFASVVLSSKLVEYKFATYFGQIIYDSSGNANHGQKGSSLSDDPGDTKSSDRGAYFRTQEETYIMLPPNKLIITPLSLSSDFSIILWVLPRNEVLSYLTYRIKDSNNYLYMKRNSGLTRFEGRIVKTTFDSTARTEAASFLINKWSIIALINQGSSSTFILDGVTEFTITQDSTYTETGTYSHYIGYTDNSFEGFVWSFYLYDEAKILTEFYSLTNSGVNCLTENCPYLCTPRIVEGGIGYCISLETGINEDAAGILCTDFCTFGCTTTLCLNCSACSTKACYIEESELKCMCNYGTESNGECSCSNQMYYSDSIIGCADCYEECFNCSEALKCESCIDRNALPDTIKGCKCKPGFYNIAPLISEGACLPCYDECTECSNQLICKSCKASNSLISLTKGCYCETGFYNTTSLVESDSCEPCNSECLTCEELNLCLTCKDSKATPSSQKGCECIKGYYKKIISLNEGACFECGQNCSVCESFENCTKCLYEKMNINGGTCDCPLNSSLINFTCTANEGFYIEENSNEYYTQKCDLSCETCNGPVDTACATCANNLKMAENVCKSCDSGQYLESNFCLKCSDECLTCESLSYCLTCSDISKIAESGSCVSQCDPGFYSSNGTCSPCQLLCSICTNTNECIECKNNSYHSENICLCSEGFKENKNSCIQKYFNASLSISSSNLVSILFNETASMTLTAENLIFL